MSLTFYLFYMVLFVGLLAAGLFFWIARERGPEDDGEDPEERRKE